MKRAGNALSFWSSFRASKRKRKEHEEKSQDSGKWKKEDKVQGSRMEQEDLEEKVVNEVVAIYFNRGTTHHAAFACAFQA